MRKILFLFILILGLGGCKTEIPADLILRNGVIYTLNETQPTAQAIAIRDGEIVFVGADEDTDAFQQNETRVIDLQGKTVTPGLVEGHAHFTGIGYGLLNLNLLETKSYDEVIAEVEKAVKKAKPGEWILGRGWHQSKWEKQPEVLIKGFQTHQRLSAVSPDNPVYLKHASGHAAMANAKAMEIAGVNVLSPENMQSQKNPEGGEVFRDSLGNPTGIFNETAQQLITDYIPKYTAASHRQAMAAAAKECLKYGITSFHDAGADSLTIAVYRQLAKADSLPIRMNVMLSSQQPSLLEHFYQQGPVIDEGNRHLTIRSIKIYTDGALGSRGAWLLEEYTDMPGHFGHETTPIEYVEQVVNDALEHGFQVAAHAIGDRANQEILDLYQAGFAAMPEKAENSRYRIEHAQHLHPDDIERFAKMGVIASMQAIHMSSDRPWAINRLGEKRIKDGAYVWQKLLQSGAVIVNGTDAPVEPLAPMPSFYASVSRRTLAGEPAGGYEPDQKMTREQALRSYTQAAAYAAFQEDWKGTLEVGKVADLTVFDNDIMQVPEEELLKTEVTHTIIGGKILYEKPKAAN